MMRISERVAAKLRYRLLLAMSMDDAKEVLGFPPGYNPTPSEIAKAYKTKALKYHPDRGGDSQKMVEVNVAKEVLEGKSRHDFVFQDDPARAQLRKDLATIRRVQETVADAAKLVMDDVRFFLKPWFENFQGFLNKDAAPVLDQLHDAAESAIRDEALTGEGRNVAKRIITMVDSVAGLALRVGAKYGKTFTRAESQVQADNVVVRDIEKVFDAKYDLASGLLTLHLESQKLSKLLFEGVGASYDDPHPIPSDLADKYHDVQEGLRFFAKSFQESEFSRLLARLKKEAESGVSKVEAVLAQYSISGFPDWKAWEIPGDFEKAYQAMDAKVKNASISQRVAARFKKVAFKAEFFMERESRNGRRGWTFGEYIGKEPHFVFWSPTWSTTRRYALQHGANDENMLIEGKPAGKYIPNLTGFEG